jgi:hypothetical protein
MGLVGKRGREFTPPVNPKPTSAQLAMQERSVRIIDRAWALRIYEQGIDLVGARAGEVQPVHAAVHAVP